MVQKCIGKLWLRNVIWQTLASHTELISLIGGAASFHGYQSGTYFDFTG